MYNDLISVIIPIYNVERYLKKCLDTVCSQTYTNLQIILVDDGSTDKSGYLADKAAEKDHRIEVIHKTNGGASDARNFGIDKVKGKYMTFIDSDDYISTDFIEYMYQNIIRYDAQIVVSGVIKTKNENDSSRLDVQSIEIMDKKEALKEMLYARKFSTSPCGKLYLTDLFSDVRYPYGKLYEDLHTIYKVFNKAEKIVYGSQICYYYLRRPGSTLVSGFSPKYMDAIEALQNLEKDIPIEEYGLTNAYSSQMIECISAMFERNPSSKQIKDLGLWDLFREHRKVVVRDKNASKRVRGYAYLSYSGLSITIFIINKYYQIKWRKEK